MCKTRFPARFPPTLSRAAHSAPWVLLTLSVASFCALDRHSGNDRPAALLGRGRTSVPRNPHIFPQRRHCRRPVAPRRRKIKRPPGRRPETCDLPSCYGLGAAGAAGLGRGVALGADGAACAAGAVPAAGAVDALWLLYVSTMALLISTEGPAHSTSPCGHGLETSTIRP